MIGVDLFGSEAVAGKSLGTDLAKGKFDSTRAFGLGTPPMPMTEDACQELVQDWKAVSLTRMNELLTKYETLSASQDVLEEYLGKARELLRGLPGSHGRSGLLGLNRLFWHDKSESAGCVRLTAAYDYDRTSGVARKRSEPRGTGGGN